MERSRKGFRRWVEIALIVGLLALAGCGGQSGGTTIAKVSTVTGTPAPTATSDAFASPSPSPTAGPPCRGWPWSDIITTAGASIPLPPLTVSGPAETFPSGSWTGRYLSLCTGGNIDTTYAFMSEHMPTEGWAIGQPPNDCQCNGARVYSRANDNRLVQIEPHPSLNLGSVRWGVTVYTRG